MATNRYPTLTELINACAVADGTDPKLANSIRLWNACNLALSLNPRIGGHYLTRATALSSFDYEVTAADRAQQQRADDAAARLRNTIATIIENHAHTPFFGSTLFRLSAVDTPTGVTIVVESIVENARYAFDLNNLYLFNENGVYTGSETILGNRNYLLDVQKFFTRPGGILRRILPIEIIRYDITLENANYLRKLKGILQIVNKGSGTDEEAQAESAARTAVQNNYLITSDLIEFKLNQITAAGGAPAFNDFLERINRDIAIACLGQANTSDLPQSGGSRAALQVQRMISADIMYSDMIRVENLINNLLLYDYWLNFDASAQLASLPYKFYFKQAEELDIEKNASTLEILTRSNIPVKRDEAYRLLGFTPPAPGDDIFPPSPPQVGF